MNSSSLTNFASFLFLIYFYFICMCFVYTYVCMYHYWPHSPEESVEFSGTEVTEILNYHVGAGNQAQVL